MDYRSGAILYARVSTDEQARSGYSLAQHLDALWEYAAREGYEVLEEVVDPGQSGLDRLAEVDSERRSYIKLAVRGTITDLDLDQALGELEEIRATAERELAALRNQQEALEALELDRDVLLELYAAIAPEALNSLIPEERHRLYKLLRITVIVQPDITLEVSGVFGEGLSLSNQGLVS